MSLLSFLRHADFVTTIFIDMMVLVFSFSAYRRTNMRAFGFLILGSAMGIISEIGLQFYRAGSYASNSDALTFLEFYRAGYLIASISWGIGIYQLIQFAIGKFGKRDKDDAEQIS
jgi:VanZ family protein